MKPPKFGRHTTPAQVDAYVKAQIAGDNAARTVRWFAAFLILAAGLYVAIPKMIQGDGWGALGIIAFAVLIANVARPHGSSIATKIQQADDQ